MLVYRVEHPETKCGPYNSGCIDDVNSVEWGLIDDMIDEHSEDSKNHPVISLDFTSEQMMGDVLCACPSLYKLYKWFDGYMNELMSMGFKVYKIEVSKVKLGKSGKQVLFHEEDILSIKIIR